LTMFKCGGCLRRACQRGELHEIDPRQRFSLCCVPLLFGTQWVLGVVMLWPTPHEYWLLSAYAVFAYGGQLCLNRGMQRCSSVAVAAAGPRASRGAAP